MALLLRLGEAIAQALMRIWLKKKCQRLWVEAEVQTGYFLVLLSLLWFPSAGFGEWSKRGEEAKQQMPFLNLGLVVMFIVNSNLLPGRLSDLGEAPALSGPVSPPVK